MPVKKTNKIKKPTKKSAGEKKMKAQIKKAVAQLPEVIAEDNRWSKISTPKVAETKTLPAFSSNYLLPKVKSVASREQIISEYKNRNSQKRILWLFVTSLAVIIMFIWAFNVFALWGSLNLKKNTPFANKFNDASQLMKQIDEQSMQKSFSDTEKERLAAELEAQKLADTKNQIQNVMIGLTISSALNSLASSTTNTVTVTSTNTFPISATKTPTTTKTIK